MDSTDLPTPPAPELRMPIPTPAVPSSSAALGRRLSRDISIFPTQSNFFHHHRASITKLNRTPSPRTNPETSTLIEKPVLTIHASASTPLVGPVAPDSPPFNVTSPQQLDTPEGQEDDGIIRVVEPRTRSLSNALNLPASPPTPAPSPIPREDVHPFLAHWNAAHIDEDDFLRTVRTYYMGLGSAERQRFLAEILNISETEELRFVNSYVRPRLKVDFLKMLPMEVGLRVLFPLVLLITDPIAYR
jgi:hypothetical protein